MEKKGCHSHTCKDGVSKYPMGSGLGVGLPQNGIHGRERILGSEMGNTVLILTCFYLINSLFSPLLRSVIWQDEEAFFKDFAESHKKLSELGFTSSSSKIIAKYSTILAEGAVGVAVCAAVVILGYLYEVRKRM
ncbi:putative L-ascorbate peroxidase [Rosa chinensis]|uniref:Putative L-ascorbate peroxidase n=1 Tax=Rosa chinensis TaxID=74649 RepID=A0A2P6PL09_ROSCH|nr:putative L-ascorbate peroxidase [Rosa chinensis]